MKRMRPDVRTAAVWAGVLAMLTLAACVPQAASSPEPVYAVVLATPAELSAQPAVVLGLTAAQAAAANQAAATAEIERANAQATLDSANATLSAAQTADQNNADVIAAQVAATAEMARSRARATLVAAGSTENAAVTQDAIRQTQQAYNFQVTLAAGTQIVVAGLIQQNKNDVAAATQTAAANTIATQTQVAAATSQWYADQSRQNAAQMQMPVTFLWMCGLPVFVIVLAGLLLWGFWRWLRIQQARQRMLRIPMDTLEPPSAEVIQPPAESLPAPSNAVLDSRYQVTRPDDPVRRWLDEVRRKLLSNDQKDEDDHNPGN